MNVSSEDGETRWGAFSGTALPASIHPSETVNCATAMESLFRYAPGGIFSYSAEEDEQFAFLSENMLAFLGYTREEFTAKFLNRFSLMVWHEDRERVLREIAEQISRGPFDTCEYRIERKDGSIVWVHDEGHIVVDENGKRWFYVVVVDITDTVDANKKLRLRNRELESTIQNLQATLDSIPGGIRVFRKEAGGIVCVNANQYYADMFGVRKEALIGETFREGENRVHPEDLERHRRETVENLDRDRRSEGTYRFFTPKANGYRWYHVEARLVKQPDGTDLAYLHYTDVDDLMRAKSDVQRSRHQYELAVKGAHLAVWEYDIASKRLTVPEGENNSVARDRYGLSGNAVENVPDAMLPMGVSDEDRTNFLRLFEEVRSGREYATADIWFRVPFSGDPRCDRITYYVEKDADGKPVKAYGVGTDVTSQKQEEFKFHQSIQTILSANPDALCTFQINLTKNLCYEGHGASPFILRALQSDTADGLFRNGQELIAYPEDLSRFRALFNRESLLSGFAEGLNSRHLDYRRRNTDGNSFWVRTYVSLLKNPRNGDVEGVIYSMDISREIRQNEIFRILTGQEYDLIALLHLDTGLVEAIHISDTIPAEYHRSFSCVGSVCHFETMRRNGTNSWVVPEDRQKYWDGTDPRRIREELDAGGRYDLTIQGNLPGRGIVYRKLQHYYLNDMKNVVLIIDSDVTQMYLQQQKELEEEKALRRQATAANEAKSEFLSRMSHDIRTPLNGIIGMTYLAREENNPQRTMDCLSKIDISSRFLLGLINDILDMSKAESRKIALHPEPYPPEEFCEYLNAVIQPLCREKHQNFVVEAYPPADVVPVFDKLRINQVIFNLLSNAVKYTPEGGTVSYRVFFTPTQRPGRQAVKIEISDTGIGMSEEFQKVLFEPFSQEGRVDASEMRGSGLGLAIAKRMMDLMGGTIRVRSQVGKGTVFTLEMEIDAVPQEKVVRRTAPGAPGAAAEALAGRHVLLCEDHPLNQELAKALLLEKGMAVEIAENGQRGVDLFRLSAVGFFDVVLMDIRMPVMNGYEAAAAIRGLPRSDAKTVPIFAMTADAFEDDVKKCLAAGMNGHVAKPIDPELLYETIAQNLPRRNVQ